MILMSLGLLASAASIRKSVIVQKWGADVNEMWNEGEAIGTLTTIEQLLASFAASAICLKAALRRLLARFGISIDSHHTPFSSFGIISRSTGAESTTKDEKELDDLNIGAATSSRLDSANPNYPVSVKEIV